MKIGYIIFAIYAIAILRMHYRGKVRFPMMRQALTHTNYLAPYNLLMDLFSKLPNKAMLDANAIDDLKTLQENWRLIRDEAQTLADQGSITRATGLNDLGFNSFFKTGWTRFYLKWYDDFLPSAQETCPNTVELLKSTPSVKAAMFASLPPGATLNPHRDPYAGSLRYHLGLITPNDDDCYILVDGEKHSWRDGEGVLFDETFIHEAHNETDKQRIILFCDVHRPMRVAIVDKVNHFISDNFLKAASTQNNETEKVGFLNRFFEKAYGVRVYSRRLKKWNRKVYVGLKYLLFFSLVYFLFLY